MKWNTQIHVKNAIHRKALLLLAIDIGFRSTAFENDENGSKTIKQLDQDVFTHILFDIKNRKISANMAYCPQFGKLMSFEEFCVALTLDLAICTVYGDEWDKKLPVKKKRKPSLSNPNGIRKGDWVTHVNGTWGYSFKVSHVKNGRAYIFYKSALSNNLYDYKTSSLKKADNSFVKTS